MTPVFARLCAVLRRFSLGKKSFTVAAAGYIGAGDAAAGGNFPLGQRRTFPEAVAQNDNFPLPGRQALLHTPPHLPAGVPGIQLLQHIVIHRDDVHQRQRAIFPRRLQRVRQGYFSLQLPLGAEVHEDLICYLLLTAPQGPLPPLLQDFPLFYCLRLASPRPPAYWETRIHTPSRTAPHGRPSHPR